MARSFYAHDDVDARLEDIPHGQKSEVINKALRQYFRGSRATREVRIEELESRIDGLNADIKGLEDERAEAEQELASLREAQNADEDDLSASTEEVVALFEGVVSVAHEDREDVLTRRAGTIPEATWRAVLDGVDIHYYEDGAVKDADPGAVVEEAGYDPEAVLGGAFGNEVTDDDAATVLAGLTDRERTEVVQVAESAQ